MPLIQAPPDALAQIYARSLFELAEADGGLAGTPVETMIVMEAMGRALVLEPYFPTVVLGGGVLHFAGNDDQRAEFIPQVAEGALKLSLAHTERNSRYDLHHVETTARRDGDGWVLSGAKSVALNGDSADRIFVTARAASPAPGAQPGVQPAARRLAAPLT
jgi:alkylation response protein AidB-like acyl-CoA dehydrogenase